MPDWSYQTVFRPLFMRMSAGAARDFALSSMGRLARLPFGRGFIALLGHMRPDDRLNVEAGVVHFPSCVGLSSRFDPQLLATRALETFGVGFIEIGPFTEDSVPGGAIDVDWSGESIKLHQPGENPGLREARQRLQGAGSVPLLLHLTSNGGDSAAVLNAARQEMKQFGESIAGIILALPNATANQSIDMVRQLRETVNADRPRLMLVAVRADRLPVVLPLLTQLQQDRLIDGVYVDGAQSAGGEAITIGRSNLTATLQAIRELRASLGPSMVIISNGGVHDPGQALDVLKAGGSIVSIDSGLVFTGPGLVKRCNEAILYEQRRATRHSEPPKKVHHARLSWVWTCLLSIGLLLGGVMAMVIAATQVIMPYDEVMTGLTREQIHEINDHLLHFMRHDRVSLAGTMLADGILFLLISIYGVRRGMHWALATILASAYVGFVSFFLFLGFGYFDPFHAFVTAVMVQLVLLATHADLGTYDNPAPPELTNDRAWRMAQWGQLLFVIHGCAIFTAGVVISTIGITMVFVQEDLEFLRCTAQQLKDAHPQLVPLIAHDRASFGGMLISCGVCVLLSSLWGFRRGHAWLWWALVLAGTIAYGAAIMVHWHVGYINVKHLIPAYGGMITLWVGALLCREHLWGVPERNLSP